MNHRRDYLIRLALVLYEDLSPCDRDGLTRSQIWKMKKADLDDFINAVYEYRRRDMLPGDFWEWWTSVSIKAVHAWWGV